MVCNKSNMLDQFEIDSSLKLHNIFERVAEIYPNHLAVVSGNVSLTYAELNESATLFASTLKQSGVKPQDLVGLCVQRSSKLIVAILGILKAEAAYIPIDPDYPKKYCTQRINSSGANYMVVGSETEDLFSDISSKVISIDARTDNTIIDQTPPEALKCEDALAYVIFTSGSSGQPKGVIVEHKKVLRLFTQAQKIFNFSKNDIWCNFHSVAFDFSVWEIWGALLFGGRLVIVSKQTAADPKIFYKFLLDKEVTVLNQTPSSFRNLIIASEKEAQKLTSLRYVIFGGEKLDSSSLIPWTNRYGTNMPSLFNMYGITETTVHLTWIKLTEAEIYNSSDLSPIGSPLSDLKINIVDENQNSLPIGNEGLIYVSGAGLARGYLNRQDLTDERFIYRASANGTYERWYNTGDIGIEICPNEFMYIGRADNQIKIRGYRIEPNEIEVLIKKNSNIKDCVVIDVDYGKEDRRLVAYLVSACSGSEEESSLLVADLKNDLAKNLPGFMCPSSYLFINQIPTNTNGKLDKEALLQLVKKNILTNNTEKYEDINLSVKENVRNIWLKILAVKNITDDDDFFDLGGTSFSLMHMLHLVNEYYSAAIDTDIFSSGIFMPVLVDAIYEHLEHLSVSPNHK